MAVASFSGSVASSASATSPGSSASMSAASSGSISRSTAAARLGDISASTEPRSATSISCSVSAASDGSSAASTAARSRGPTCWMMSAMSAACRSASSVKASMKLRRESAQRDQVDVVPGDELPLLAAAGEEPQTDAPQHGRAAGVDARHDQAAAAALERDVLHAEELAPRHVEHLVVEHLVDQGDLVGAQRGGRELLERDRQPQLAAVEIELRDLGPARAQLLVVVSEDQARHDRRLRQQGDDHVGHVARGCAVAVEDRHLLESGEGERLLVHGAGATPCAACLLAIKVRQTVVPAVRPCQRVAAPSRPPLVPVARSLVNRLRLS